jgi:hypothetical protein
MSGDTKGNRYRDRKLFNRTWEDYLDPIKTKVWDRATELAQTDGRQQITTADAFDAIREYIPGKAFSPAPPEGWFHKNITGFIAITAVLTITFGILGTLPQTKDAATGLFEIAKMLAGALIGGAAGAAAFPGPKRQKNN